MKKMRLTLWILLLVLVGVGCKKSTTQTEEETLPDVELKTKVILSGLTLPWELIYGPDNAIWFTEKAGKISRVNPETGATNLVFTVPDVRINGEGGLLGMALHPSFTANPYVYVVYNYGTTYREKVVRYTYSGGSLTNPLILIDQIPASSIHNGARLLISGNYLFISTGDAADQPSAQNINSLSGKILRINLDGSIPADNPYPNSAVWSIGHRNPQGLVMVGNQLFSAEHGPDSDDEVNIISKGRNYGWPNVKGFCNETGEQGFCNSGNVVEPLMAWTPTIAPSGIAFYNHDYIPQFGNSLLMAVLKDSKLVQLQLNESQNRIVKAKDFYVN